MVSRIKNIMCIISAIRLIPHILLWKVSKNNGIIYYDVMTWLKIGNQNNAISMPKFTELRIAPHLMALYI